MEPSCHFHSNSPHVPCRATPLLCTASSFKYKLTHEIVLKYHRIWTTALHGRTAQLVKRITIWIKLMINIDPLSIKHGPHYQDSTSNNNSFPLDCPFLFPDGYFAFDLSISLTFLQEYQVCPLDVPIHPLCTS